MKKIMTIAAAITVATLSSTAMAGDWFVGLEGGKANNKISASGTVHDFISEKDLSGSVSDKKAKSKFYGVRVGKYLDDNVRVYGTLSKNKFKNSKVDGDRVVNSQKSLMLSSDYVFMKDSSIRLFAGVSLGATRVGAFGKNKTALAYGAQAGVMFQAGPVDMELGMKYLGNNAKVKLDAGEFGNGEVKFNNSRQAYLSASYRF
ncbi:outer membrane beta-barrel protein [Endozoicomonas elysicola]|nr:outer membrane beta-barrel protein [Endozoicomonas elysicola]